MKLGNIVYEDELVNHKKVDYINYYKGKYSYKDIDNNLPTLFVGWGQMKLLNIDDEIFNNCDILDHRIISNKLYWEFSFEENKSSHVRGVESFIGYVPEFYFLSKYTYINLDPVFFQLRDNQDLYDVLPKEIDKFYNYKNEMIFILYMNKITGLDLKMYEFFKFNNDNIIEKIKERCNNNFINDEKGIIYKKYENILTNFNKLKRYIVCIEDN